MSSFEPNYTIIGNPIISDDYILTYAAEDNILTFNDAGILDTTKDLDFIIRLKINETQNYADSGILLLGSDNDLDNSISIFHYYDSIGLRFGQNYISVGTYYVDTSDYIWIKFSYIVSEAKLYSYVSENGIGWQLYDESSLWNEVPTISIANNIIGEGLEYETIYMDHENINFDLSAFEIYVDGSQWYSAINKEYSPVVKAKNLYVKRSAFAGNTQITEINCNNATFIDGNMSRAFTNCSNLQKVTNISNTTTNLSYAFAGLPVSFYNYNFPNIPSTVNDISGLFAYHTEWTDIPVQAFLNAWNKIPAHLQTNVAGFLDGCTNLSNVPSNTLPDFMTNIANGFRNCRAMTNMPIITANIQDMSGAFYNCTNLTNANYEIPKSVINMSDAFYMCANLKNAPSLVNATNVVNMREAFFQCRNIQTVDKIPNSVQDLSYTFSYCSNLQSIPSSIPNSVTNLAGAFQGCSNITVIPNISNNAVNMAGAFSYCYNVTSIPAIPNSVTNMYMAFSGCNNVTTMSSLSSNVQDLSYAFSSTKIPSLPTLPNTITNMLSAFSECTNLSGSIYIPDGVLNASHAFYNCVNVTTISHLSNTVTDLGTTFNNCRQLNYAFVIPNTVTNLQGTFSNCINLKVTPDLTNAINVKTVAGMCEYCSNLTTPPVIPPNVTNMYNAFRSCINLTDMPEIPSNVADMSFAFANCTNLINTTNLPSNVQNVFSLFMGCSNLQNFPEIPNSINRITRTYSGCSNLKHAQKLPANIESIDGAYNLCYNLTSAIPVANTIQNYNDSFRFCNRLGTAPIVGKAGFNIANMFYYANNVGCNFYILSKNINCTTNLFYASYANITRDVFIPMYYTVNTNVPLYCWNCKNDTNKADIQQFYTDRYLDNYNGSMGNLDIYYSNGVKVKNYLGDYYNYYSNGIPELHIHDTSWSIYYTGKRDIANDTTVVLKAGSTTKTYNTFINTFTNTTNVTRVGSPSISNGIASNFGDSKYLTIPSTISTAEETKLYIKATCPSSLSTTWPRLISFTTDNCVIYLNPESGVIGFNNGSSNIGSTTNSYFNTTFWVRVVINATKTTVSATVDNDYTLDTLSTWESQATWETITDNEDFRNRVSNLIYLGNNGESGRYFGGSIDLNNCIMYTNKQISWKGMKFNNTINLRNIDDIVQADTSNNKVVGDLVIDEDYIASNFSINNYILFPLFQPGNKPWEIQFKVKYNSSGAAEQFILGNSATTYQGIVFSIHNGKLHLYCDSEPNASGRFIGSFGTTTFVNGNTYYIRVSFDGVNKYLAQSSTNGKTWTTELDVTNTRTIYNSTENKVIGQNRNSLQFSGTIDLRESYAKIGSKMIWTGDGINFIKYGSLLDHNGVISNFTRYNYIMGKETIRYSSNFEIIAKINTRTLRNSNNWVISSDSNATRNICWGLTSSKNIRIYLSSDGTSWDIANSIDGTSQLKNNTEYLLKLIYNGSNYIVSYSEDDGETWIEDINIESNLLISNQKICIGTNESQSNWFGGAIDLKIINKQLSGFNADNYILLPYDFNPGSSTWEWHTKFTTGSSVSGSDQYIGGPDIKSSCGLEAGFRDSKFALWVGSVINSYDIVNGVRSEYEVQPNTTYWVKIYFTGTSYKLDYSLDGITYTNAISVDSTATVYGYGKCIGTDLNNATNCRFRGSIDLNYTYIKINGKIWWKPYIGVTEKYNLLPVQDASEITVTNDHIINTNTNAFRSGINIKPGNKSWEIMARFKKNEHGSNWTDPINFRAFNADGSMVSNKYYMTLEDTTNSSQCSMWAVFSTSGGSWNYSFNNYSIPFNKFYYHRVGWDTTKYYYYVSEDGINWIIVQEAESTTPIYGNSTDNIYALFGCGNCNWIYDFTKIYVKVDNKIIWTPSSQSRLPNYMVNGQLQYTGNIVSGFTLDDYICLPDNFVPDEKSFDICIKFKPSYNTRRFKLFGTYSEQDNKLPAIQVNASGYIGWAIPNENGTAWQNETYSSTYHTETDTWYWVRLTRDSSYNYKLYVSIDGVIYTEVLAYTGTKMYNALKEGMCIGTDIYRITPSENLSFNGAIDLDECYINIDDKPFWKPFIDFLD